MHRPYAKDPNSPPSVTTVLGTVSKQSLVWAAANETARHAVDYSQRWLGLPSDQAYDVLRKHHRGLWDHRALLGTAVHRANEHWCVGDNVSIGELVDEIREESVIWRRRDRAELCEELRVMVIGLSDAWIALQPQTLSFEDVVRFGDPDERPGLSYVGTSDWRVVVNGVETLVDLKTTGQTKRGSARYWDSWRLQLAAYRYADTALDYSDTGQLVGTHPLQPVSATAVLLIRADGQWELLDVTAEHAEHAIFLALRAYYEWYRVSDSTRGHGLRLEMGSQL